MPRSTHRPCLTTAAHIVLLVVIGCGTAQAGHQQSTSVFVSDFGLPDGSDSRVERFDLSGKHTGTFKSADLVGAAPGAWGPDGDCWIPSHLNGKIVEFDPVTLAQTSVIDVGGKPIAVDFDSEGKLLVVKYDQGAVERWTLYGEKLGVMAKGLHLPDSVRVHGGRVFVGQREGAGFAVFNEVGWAPISGSPFHGVDSLPMAAEGIVIGPDRNSDGAADIYIADRRTDDGSNRLSRIVVYSGADHTLVDGGLITGLSMPLGLAALPDGSLAFTECGRTGVAETSCIKRWDGKEVSEFTNLRATGGRFNGLFVVPGSRGASSTDPAKIAFFDEQVRPLLAARCWSCHGTDDQMAGLRLDSWQAIESGGKSGSPVIAGKPDESLLIQAVRQTGELRMPREDQKLTPAEIATLARWIEEGAVWTPEDSSAPSQALAEASSPTFTPEQTTHWAFQRIADPPPPVVTNNAWPTSRIDHFILNRLEKNGLAPAPRAAKHELLRRLTFDLTGLPPTPDELKAFLADHSPEAVARVVDRLLDSRHYGERWGRHWLDVVRYADTTGNDGNFVLENAYRFRDYVVHAFNSDKPYDQFLVEQLAGDLLPDGGDALRTLERVTATGFLMLGSAGLAEADKEQVIMDLVDDQIDVTGRAMLGLTLGCARCHDHKFDPVPTADYYSLAGIFRSTCTMIDLDQSTSRWHERQMPTGAGGQVKVLAPGNLPGRDLRIHVRGSHFSLGAKVPRRFPQIIADRGQPGLQTTGSGRLALARWISSADNPLTARVAVNRIWQKHFGVGLVRTGDNFGMSGEPPSDPDLLDWLASRFIESGWSVKAMHRRMLLSSTYAMSCALPPQASVADPDNRLLCRMHRRRLEAEEIRDAMLAISGELDETIGGGGNIIESLYQQGEVAEEPRRLVSAAKISTEFAGFKTLRRALYMPVVRNCTPQLMALYDCADGNSVTANRGESTMPLQSLLMLNDGWVRERALQFARRLLGMTDVDDRRRIEEAYLRALAPPQRTRDRRITDLHQRVSRCDSSRRGLASRHEPRTCLAEFLPNAILPQRVHLSRLITYRGLD